MSNPLPGRPGNFYGGQNPNTNAGFGQTSPRLTVSTDTSGYTMHLDSNRLWYIYQVGSRLAQFTCSILDSDIEKFTAGTGVQIALKVPDGFSLRNFDSVFMWCPAVDKLIEVQHTKQELIGLSCHYIRQFTSSSRPDIAKGFQLGEMDATPEFKSGEEALRWMEENS